MTAQKPTPDDQVFMMGKFAARIPTDRRYTANHMWLRPAGDALRFGLTAYAVRLLREIYFVEWSVREGDPIKQREELGAIESAKAITSVCSPITGTMAVFNPAVLADPSLVNRDNYGDGWLFEVTASADGTMEPQQYLAWLGEAWAKAQALLKNKHA